MSLDEIPITEDYGIEWKPGLSQLDVELQLYRFAALRTKTGTENWQHMTNAIALLYPPSVFKITPWTLERVEDWCQEDWFIQMGAGSTGKSSDMAMIVWIDFLAAPAETTTQLYSTTKDKLRHRIWREISRFYQHAPCGMSYRKGQFSITFGNDVDTINGIFGNGVLRDDGTLAVANLVGRHNKRNRCICDELQGVPYSVIRSTANQSLGGESFKFTGMGNPESKQDTLGRQATPKNGYKTITINSKRWRNALGGLVVHYDGLQCPAILLPNGKKDYHFLLQKKDVAFVARTFGEESPEYFSQIRGWFTEGAAEDTVLTWPLIAKNYLQSEMVFAHPSSIRHIWGLDPAYGGDRCILAYAQVGRDQFGVTRIAWQKMIRLKVAVSEEQTRTDQIITQTREIMEPLGFTAKDLAMDTSGQQFLLADSFDKEWGPGVYRVDFGGGATREPFNALDKNDKRTNNQVFGNRVSELWNTYHLYAREGQIRGLDDSTASEFCSRKIIYRNGKRWVMPKDEMKASFGVSPDRADAQVAAVAKVRFQWKILPGGGVPHAGRQRLDHTTLNRQAYVKETFAA